MFLRFTKRNGKADRVYRRAVFLNDTILVQHGDDIVAYAYLQSASGNTGHFVIEVTAGAGGERVDCEEVVRYVKRFIGNAGKWERSAFARRTYEVNAVDRLDMGIFSLCKTTEKANEKNSYG